MICFLQIGETGSLHCNAKLAVCRDAGGVKLRIDHDRGRDQPIVIQCNTLQLIKELADALFAEERGDEIISN